MDDFEVDALRAELALLQTEYDRWVTVALERRTELANLDATVTATMIALSDTGGADGWRPPRGVSPLIDRALDVREARDAERKRADAIKIEAERAAVVAWLRAGADAPHPIEAGERALSPSGRGLLLLAADRIERGDHRREVAE